MFLTAHEVETLGAFIPAHREMVTAVMKTVGSGLKIAYMHLVFQALASKTRAGSTNDTALFTVHQDGEADELLTVIVLLSDTKTAMQIVGKQPYNFDGESTAGTQPTAYRCLPPFMPLVCLTQVLATQWHCCPSCTTTRASRRCALNK